MAIQFKKGSEPCEILLKLQVAFLEFGTFSDFSRP